MVDTERLTWPLKRREDFTRIVAYIVLSMSFIFIIDVITPLGVMIWILYLIPWSGPCTSAGNMHRL